MQIIEYLTNQTKESAKEEISNLQRLLRQHPECKPLIQKLLCPPSHIIRDAFGLGVKCYYEPQKEWIPIGYAPEPDDLLEYLSWINFFVGHEILDDGDLGIGWFLPIAGGGQFLCYENEVLAGDKIPAVPFVCSCADLLPYVPSFSMQAVIDVIEAHERIWEQRSQKSPSPLPSKEECQRRILAEELGLC